jgi:hypothetical protein
MSTALSLSWRIWLRVFCQYELMKLSWAPKGVTAGEGMEPLTGIEPVTSSLPRTRSTI